MTWLEHPREAGGRPEATRSGEGTAIWAAGNIWMPVMRDAGWGCLAAFPRTQHRQPPPPRDWRNESGRWRNWFGKQLVTGDLPTPVPERDSGRLGAGWRCSLGRGMKGIAPLPKPAAHRPWAHATGPAPKIPQVPPGIRPWLSPGPPDAGGRSFSSALMGQRAGMQRALLG